MDKIDLDLCCDCFDKIMVKYIIPNCKYSPIQLEDHEDTPDELFDDMDDDEPEDENDFFDMLYEGYRHRFDPFA